MGFLALYLYSVLLTGSMDALEDRLQSSQHISIKGCKSCKFASANSKHALLTKVTNGFDFHTNLEEVNSTIFPYSTRKLHWLIAKFEFAAE